MYVNVNICYAERNSNEKRKSCGSSKKDKNYKTKRIAKIKGKGKLNTGKMNEDSMCRICLSPL
jgi:hypothetical protein